MLDVHSLPLRKHQFGINQNKLQRRIELFFGQTIDLGIQCSDKFWILVFANVLGWAVDYQ